MSEWQPIETAPKDGTHVLLHVEGYVVEAWWDAEGYFYDYSKDEAAYGKWEVAKLAPHGCGCCSSELNPPKFWMPLPPPPEVK